jgi:hypothetical protein
VDNFVGIVVAAARTPCPVLLRASLPAFAASLRFQQNQQLSRFDGLGLDAAQQMTRSGARIEIVGISQSLSAHSPAKHHD